MSRLAIGVWVPSESVLGRDALGVYACATCDSHPCEPSVSVVFCQPRMGGHAMGAHFNVAMRAMQHIQLYTYHVHALGKCVLAQNGRFRW